MAYHYLAFGIPVISEIELPALFPINESSNLENPVYVKLGLAPVELTGEGQNADRNAYCNADEMIYTISKKIKFYISNGNQVIIEPIAADYRTNLIYFYSNGLAAILYQRDMIPFHVSGVFTGSGKVALFAAPSGTGKSTLAVKLQELGFQPFTDDTAVLFIKDGKCYAQASYPMIRLWEQTLDQQHLLNIANKQKIFDDGDRDKFGFSFHSQFATAPVEVEKIIFLDKEGSEMRLSPIGNIEAFKALSDNVYRNHWIPVIQKSKLQFSLVGKILNCTPYFLALRPKDVNSISEFPLFVKKILQNVQN
ncbi:hypothetical protein U0035_09765 [Niabella yanshanensis]|uniref:Serine kinase n=1 Tax=Niabella yanshanensis TaxID=577386 RepID=A0ABZ0WAV9_9BACT|nr:hypothetical protein [Niabella yanshanensis]WQD40432.1 hypothetical protein U0035_09765 [Niabella yanshanensis]